MPRGVSGDVMGRKPSRLAAESVYGLDKVADIRTLL